MWRLYGQLSPRERKAMDNKWSAQWNTVMPIEHYFKVLEEMFILANKYPPPIHDGTDGRKGTDSDRKMRIFSIAP